MANEGKRCFCICKKEMMIKVADEETILFAFKKIYPCAIRSQKNGMNYYKIYGEEFALSCSEKEFNEYFKIIKHHNN